jgi:hypothetical protein
MFEFVMQPSVYSTGTNLGLRQILEKVWIHQPKIGVGTIYIISGFANFNGGARFYRFFEKHINAGGKVSVILGASTGQRLSSKQVVEALLQCGAEVHLINRKRILHAKCYGYKNGEKETLVVSSGNFTGPGMSQNIEATISLTDELISSCSFSWEDLFSSLLSQSWQIHACSLTDPSAPFWDLLYDEIRKPEVIDTSDSQTLIMNLTHADTVRIQAASGDIAGKGSQYFFLSKDCFHFFPPLIEPNRIGIKRTWSTEINLNYIDLAQTRKERVTFEAENNLDFRLGTGALRYSEKAKEGDLACITRISENDYELRIIPTNAKNFPLLDSYAVNFIGNRGKRFGFIDNPLFLRLLSSP